MNLKMEYAEFKQKMDEEIAAKLIAANNKIRVYVSFREYKDFILRFISENRFGIILNTRYSFIEISWW